ncbi:MAG: hypothetical protein ACM3JC_11850 [Rudaea sp.]
MIDAAGGDARTAGRRVLHVVDVVAPARYLALQADDRITVALHPFLSERGEQAFGARYQVSNRCAHVIAALMVIRMHGRSSI